MSSVIQGIKLYMMYLKINTAFIIFFGDDNDLNR